MTTFSVQNSFGGRPVPPWLRQFQEAPVDALEALLLGRAQLLHLGADEPVEVLGTWLANLDPDSGFAETVDAAMAAWVDQRWGQFVLPGVGSAAVVSAAWSGLGDLVASDERLVLAAAKLRTKLLDDRLFLRALTESPSRDPEGRVWLALARHQQDRSLLEQWWQLCNLPTDAPFYHGIYGVYGLAGLPGGGGGFSTDVAHGLLRLVLALCHLCTEGWLLSRVAESEFLRIARLMQGRYPFPGRWAAHWAQQLRDTQQLSPAAARQVTGWIQKLKLPPASPDDDRRSRAAEVQLPAGGLERVQDIARRLESSEEVEQAIVDAHTLLDQQRRYAAATGNNHFAVRSACNFAGRLRRERPAQAWQFAQQAVQLDPANAFAWTTLASTELTLGRLSEAQRYATHAVRAFPNDVVAQNGLAEVLKAQGRLEEAEAQYRQTVRAFPNDMVAQTGLAEVLKAQGRLEEAEAQYRQTVRAFPDNVVARNGLAEVLKAQGRLAAAEAQYRQTVRAFPNDVVAQTGLAEVLKAQGRLEEAEAQYRQTVRAFPDNVVARNGLAEVLKAQGRLEEAEAQYRQTVRAFPDNVVARTGLAEVLKAQGRLAAAEAQYRQTVRAFPDNVVARNGLPEVLKAQGRLAAAEAWTDAPPVLLDGPPHRLAQPNLTDSPLVSPEAEAAAAALLPVAPLERTAIDMLVADTSCLRHWARDSGTWQRQETPGGLRQRATVLLQKLLPQCIYDPRAAEEWGLLMADEGQLDEGVRLLRKAAKHFPGSIRVRYALARVERLVSVRDRLQLTPQNQQRVVQPLLQMVQLEPKLQPLQLLAESRAWFSLVDGETRLGYARKTMSELGMWVNKQPSVVSIPSASDTVHDYFARELHTHLFAEQPIRCFEELPDIGSLEQRVATDSYRYDRLEENLLFAVTLQ